MARKGYTPEQIIGKLREVEVLVLVHQGHTIREGHVPSSGVRVRHPVDVV